jgi:hypothetical protein
VLSAWAIAFVTTLVVETPVYVWGLRERLSRWRAGLLAAGLNVATHPLAWMLTARASWAVFAAVEAAVWLGEALLLWALMRGARARSLALGEACTLSLVANALSAGVGLLLA